VATWTLLALAVTCGAAASDPAPAAEKPKLIVLDLTTAGGVGNDVASVLNDAITSQVAGGAYFSVLSSKEVQTMLGMERQRQMMGCSEDSSSCLTELAGALGARFVMSGSVAKLGDAFQLSLQTLDTSKAQPVGRSTRLAKDLETLRRQLPYSVAEATGTPPPAPPSRLMPYSMMIGGGVLAVAGGIVGLSALSEDAGLRKEFEVARDNPQAATLRSAADYRRDAAAVSAKKTVSLIAVLAGAGLAGVGFYLNPPGLPDGTTATLTPSGTGFALVGVFP
jgi:hypothetical protein